jgi:hypothetical protein
MEIPAAIALEAKTAITTTTINCVVEDLSTN